MATVKILKRYGPFEPGNVVELHNVIAKNIVRDGAGEFTTERAVKKVKTQKVDLVTKVIDANSTPES